MSWSSSQLQRVLISAIPKTLGPLWSLNLLSALATTAHRTVTICHECATLTRGNEHALTPSYRLPKPVYERYWFIARIHICFRLPRSRLSTRPGPNQFVVMGAAAKISP